MSRQINDSVPAGLLRTPADTLNETSKSDDIRQPDNWGVIRQTTCTVLRGWAPTSRPREWPIRPTILPLSTFSVHHARSSHTRVATLLVSVTSKPRGIRLVQTAPSSYHHPLQVGNATQMQSLIHREPQWRRHGDPIRAPGPGLLRGACRAIPPRRLHHFVITFRYETGV
ncbi:hypothetical protein GE21DRAFT_1111073 [Neurospora crassa]|nr:hypothetical protein GE21DRAFT_1111073 [Neurospora crassa]